MYRKTLLFLFSFMPITSWAFPGDIVFDPSVEAAVAGMASTTNANMVIQINNLVQQCAYLKQQLAVLQGGDYRWSDAQNKINEVGSLVSQSTQLAYNANNLDGNFRKTFPGYARTTNYPDQYQSMVTNTMNTLNGILRGSGTNAADFQNESERLKYLQTKVQDAQGQTQAIQAASQIASEEATQLQLLRQEVVSQTNAQTVYYAAEVQKEASRESSLNEVLQRGSKTSQPIGSSGQSVDVPDF